MGFNKRYINISTIRTYIENGYPVSKVFEADALFFMDDFSNQIYKLCLEGANNDELKKIVQNETELRNQ